MTRANSSNPSGKMSKMIKPNIFKLNMESLVSVPTRALNLRNDCKVGRWKVGELPCGEVLRCVIVGQAEYFGQLGKNKTELISFLQVWLVPLEGSSVPPNTLYCTYLKKESWSDFTRCLIGLQSQKIPPEEGIFIPEFKYKQSDKGDYYFLQWKWEPSELVFPVYESLEKQNAWENSMFDGEGTKQMICLEGMTNNSKQEAIADFKRAYAMQNKELYPELMGNTNKQLPST
jgi:hypothetical protein